MIEDKLAKRKEIYLSKILEIGCKIKANETLIVELPEEAIDVENILIRFQEKYHINIIFYKRNSKKDYNFFKKKHTFKEQMEYFPSLNFPDCLDNVKYLYLGCDNQVTDKYLNMLYYADFYQEYSEASYKVQGKDFEKITELLAKNRYTIAPIPSNAWARTTGMDKKAIWRLLFKTLPAPETLHEEILRLKEIQKYLNSLSIDNLYFYTKSGTDLKVGLHNYSRWSSICDNKSTLINFPSYEIFTSPDKYKIAGKIIIAAPSTLYGNEMSEGCLTFDKGKLIECEIDNEELKSILMYDKNKLNYCGEIGLVSPSSPLAKMHKTFRNLLLDENCGCHLALGNSLDSTLNIPKDKNKEEYNFNESNYHQDIVFGDDSILVEATVNGKKRVLIENGDWRI